MTDESKSLEQRLEAVDPSTLSIDRVRSSMTTRQIGAWEIAAGVPMVQFPATFAAMVLVWWAANQDGVPMTPDEALDLDDDEEIGRWALRAVELLGPTTGVEQPSPSSTTPRSSTSRRSGSSSASRSRSSAT